MGGLLGSGGLPLNLLKATARGLKGWYLGCGQILRLELWHLSAVLLVLTVLLKLLDKVGRRWGAK